MKFSQRKLQTASAFMATLVVLGISGCAPIVSHQGYLAIEAFPGKDVVVGESISSVQEKLGSPSQTSAFEPNIWYYIDQTTQKITYKKAKVTDRTVTVIEFDKAMQAVTSVRTLSIADARNLNPNQNETPTRGRSMTALEQVLGTVGRQSIRREGENPGDQQRRGQ